MNNKWYQSAPCKGILIVLEHILAVVMITCLVLTFSYPGDNLAGILLEKPHKKYEQSKGFTDKLMSAANDITAAEGYDSNFETEGKYDENRDLWENGVQLVTTNIQNKMLQLLYNENRQSALIYSDMQHITRNMIIISLFLAAFLVVVTTMMITIIPRSISKPVRYLSSITKEVADGNLEVRAHMEHGVDVKLLADSLNVMIEKIKTLIDNVMLEQMRLREAELEILQMQINPHFLYNTLDTIVWLAEAGQKEQVVSMVQTLSDFFRASLNSGKDIVSLEGECRHITSYLQIQQVRYQDILTYDVDIPEEIANCKIPKITLQPLVENALYHGIKNKRGKGKILIEGFNLGDDMMLRVTDNGQGMTPERLYEVQEAIRTGERAGFGLAAVSERIVLYYGPGYGLKISSTEGEGTVMEVYMAKKINLDNNSR